MNLIDRQILDWIQQRTTDAALRAQIAAATITRRDYMRTGFFIYLTVPETLPPVPPSSRPVAPDIESPQLLDGGGSELMLRNGRLHYLELYAKGGFFPESIDDFTLLEPE